MKVGRNDPCPCGSGRKYKHCHLNAEGEVAPADGPWEGQQELSQRLPSNLLRFATSRWGKELVDEAWSEFTLFEDQAFDRDSVHLPVFLPWFFYEWKPDPQNTSVPPRDLDAFPVVSAYLAGRGRYEDSIGVRYLEACRSSSFSFLDLLEVSPGSGFAVRDALTRWQGFVTERSGSRMVHKGDILFAMVVTHDGLSVLDGCSPVAFPPVEKAAIIELRNRIRQTNPTITVDVLKDYGLEMLEVYHTVAQRLLHPPPPEQRGGSARSRTRRSPPAAVTFPRSSSRSRPPWWLTGGSIRIRPLPTTSISCRKSRPC